MKLEQKAALWQRCEALAAEYPVEDLPETDAGLIEAERRLRELRPQTKALRREFNAIITPEVEEEIIHPTVIAAESELEAFIDEVEPETVIGCAVKLRRLANECTGLCSGSAQGSVEQILAVVERQAELHAAINHELARRAS